MSTSGTTATVCLINETLAELTVCNVGDSFAILVPKPGTAAAGSADPCTTLTVSHRLQDSAEERERVAAAGGFLGQAAISGLPAGPLRAFPGGVCCARSLGVRSLLALYSLAKEFVRALARFSPRSRRCPSPFAGLLHRARHRPCGREWDTGAHVRMNITHSLAARLTDKQVLDDSICYGEIGCVALQLR